MIHSQHVTALVPIKDNSERVKGKNFRDFCGEPLFHHILRTLERTYAVDEIFIDTDSPRVILEAPRLSSKVRVFERPPETRGDMVSMNKVLAVDIDQLPDTAIFLQTHTTNPLLKADTVAQALKAFVEDEDHDSLFGVNAYQSRFYRADGSPINHDPDDLIRTQDLPWIYEENSCLYVFTRESFQATQARIGRTPLLFPTPRIESVDIDDELTFRLAEILALYHRTAP